LLLLRLQEQRLLLKGAHVTLISTMDHLAVANLLEGRAQKAIKMLRRIYDLQRAAHGPNDPRCTTTRQKIMTIRGQQIQAFKNASFEKQQQEQRQRAESDDELPSKSTAARPEPRRQTSQPLNTGGVEQRPATTSASSLKETNGDSTSRCIGGIGGPTNNGTLGGSGKTKNSMFKAIRSFGRSKKA